MALDGALGQEQLSRDLTVCVAHDDKTEDLLLTRGQRRGLDLRSVPPRHACLTCQSCPYGRCQRCFHALLQNHASRARGQCSAYAPALDARADHNRRHVRERPSQRLDRARESHSIIDRQHDQLGCWCLAVSKQALNVVKAPKIEILLLEDRGETSSRLSERYKGYRAGSRLAPSLVGPGSDCELRHTGVTTRFGANLRRQRAQRATGARTEHLWRVEACASACRVLRV